MDSHSLGSIAAKFEYTNARDIIFNQKIEKSRGEPRPKFKDVKALVGFVVDLSNSMQQYLDADKQLNKLEIFRQSLGHIAEEATDIVKRNRTADSKPKIEVFGYGYGFRELDQSVNDLLALIEIGPKILDKKKEEIRKIERTIESKYGMPNLLGNILDTGTNIVETFDLTGLTRILKGSIKGTTERTRESIINVEIPRAKKEVAGRLKKYTEEQLKLKSGIPRPVQDVLDLWQRNSEDVLAAEDTKQFLFGEPTLIEALENVAEVFEKELSSRFQDTIPLLFILSGGTPTSLELDDFKTIRNRFNEREVIVISCLVTSQSIALEERRSLFTEPPPKNWSKFEKYLFWLSSEVKAEFKEDIKKILINKGWNVEDKSKLFIRVNHQEVLEEFVEATLSPLDLKDK